MSEIQRVMLVGHCGFDAGSIRQAVRRADSGVDVVDATRADDVENAGPETLLLINRQLGWGFNADTGVELIRRLSGKSNPPAMMLVSNYDDAQRTAVEAGALPGFGKSGLHNPETLDRLRSVIRGTPDAEPSNGRNPV